MEMFKQMPELSFLLAAPTLSLVRFGKWEEVLKEPAPPETLPMPSLLHHYARARAFAATAQYDDAEAELKALQAIMDKLPENAMAAFAPGKTIATVALETARGDLLCRRGKTADGLARLRAAVAAHDTLPYDEPPDWYYPVRQTLGAWLLKARKPADAQKVFEEDLAKNPDNGWSLIGLKEALRVQKKSTATVEAKLDAVWKQADVSLASSDFL
jgi:predicted Zn-dependent protease